MLHWIATNYSLLWAILFLSHFLLILTINSSSESQIDLLVHFKRYLARSQIKNNITMILRNSNISHEIGTNGGMFEAKYTDFMKIKIDETDLSITKQVLKELPDVKGFSLDKRIKWEPKNDVTNERILPYDYKFLTNLTEELNLPYYWNQGIKGQGVKIAIFDTGISDVYKSSNSKNIKKINNWSDEQYANGMDFNGHGTFVTSIITNSNKECPGIAPDAQLFIFKVYTKNEETSYSWFLEAFNICIQEKIDLISFSMGSTNFIETAFVQKIKEVIENGITIIAAAGNDGPFFGTINHPADLNEVLAVGGIDAGGVMVAGYSSRGMTNSELTSGMGRVKPDIVTSSKFIISANTDGECDTKSGTSVAVPIVTGSLALILSSLSPQDRARINPALLRQGLIETAKKLEEVTMFEQGAGLFDLKKAFFYFQEKVERKLTLFPSRLNLTYEETYTYPYSLQPLYHTGVPMILNLTVHNSLTKLSKVSRIEWISKSTFKNYIDIQYRSSEEIYPYFGNVALIISMKTHKLQKHLTNGFHFDGKVRVYFDCFPDDESGLKEVHADVQLVLQLANTPPREKRILWDQFHNMKFPESGFIPRDSLTNLDYPYEWHGDHPYINFIHLFKVIQKRGYFLEILRGSFECFDANKYGILLIVDPEDKYSEKEIAKLQEDVVYKGLSVILFAEWYDPHLMTLNTFEPKVKSHKNSPSIPTTPVTGGSNIPALNTLLRDFGIALGTSSYAGDFKYANRTHSYLSGSYLIRFPKNGVLLTFDLYNESNLIIKKNFRSIQYEPKPILGLLKDIYNQPTSGRFIVYGDSNCIDSAYMTNNCFDLFRDMLQFIETGRMNLLEHFHNYELPQNYIAKEEVVYFNDKDQPLIKDFSKHENPNMWDKSLCCEDSYPAKRTVDFTELKILSEISHASVDNWVSKQKEKSLEIISAKDYTLMEYMQSILMTFSVILIVFMIYLVRKRRKRSRYSPMERAKGQVIIV